MVRLSRSLGLALLLISSQAQAATSGIDPNYLKLKIYKVAISTSPLCTNLITVYDNDSPAYENFLDNPTLGSGAVANGSYECVVIEFSDALKFSPSQTSDNNHCVANVEHTMDICGTGTSTKLIDGSTEGCLNSENKVAMYLSTGSTQTAGTSGHNAFEPPTSIGDATKGFKLSGSLKVSGAKSAIFVVNGLGKIEESGGQCDMTPPEFSFR